MKKLYVLLLFLFPLLCLAQTSKKEMVVNGIKYDVVMSFATLGDNIYDVPEYAIVVSNDYSGDVVIPESIEVEGFDKEQYTNRVLNIPVKGVSYDAFSGCSNLTSISIPKSVSLIGRFGERNHEVSLLASGCSFSRCNNLKQIAIDKDNKVFEIRRNLIVDKNTNTALAFFMTEGNTTVYIDESIKQIGELLFDQLDGVTGVYCYHETPLATMFGTYYNMPSGIDNVLLYVPTKSRKKYEEDNFWGSFKKVLPIDGIYILAYNVDGAEYKSFEVKEGSDITPEPEPTKDGYTFSGWSEIPFIMPSHDVTVTGTFTANVADKYKLTYMVDGAEYRSYMLKVGSTIIPIDEPMKEGYTFSGWSEIPEEMPAHDVVVTGTFTKDILGKCATPTIEVVNGRLKFLCETEGVTFKATYQLDNSINEIDGDDVVLGGTAICKVSVYATKEDYEDSDVATADVEIAWGRRGDVNADGDVNVGDIVTVTNIMSGKDD